jgi:transposase
VGDRTAVRNRVHSLLAVRLLNVPFDELFGPAGRAWLQRLSAEELDPQGRLILDADLRLHDTIEREINTLEEEMARRGYSDARVKLLMTLPGVDVTVAETLVAALGDVSRFPTADHAASYVGLTPSTRQSANRCYHGPITKAGNSHARWTLVQAAHHVAKHPGPLGHFFRKLSKRKNYNVAVVATARKLVVIAWHLLTSNEPYRYATPDSTAHKLARLRIRATGRRRKTGPAKGMKGTPLVTGGGRTIKSLARVYHQEGLPEPRELSAGERRMVQQSGAGEHVASLANDRVVPRHKKPAADAQRGRRADETRS